MSDRPCSGGRKNCTTTAAGVNRSENDMMRQIVRCLAGGAALLLALAANQAWAQSQYSPTDESTPTINGVDNNGETGTTASTPFAAAAANYNGGTLSEVIIQITGSATYNNLSFANPSTINGQNNLNTVTFNSLGTTIGITGINGGNNLSSYAGEYTGGTSVSAATTPGSTYSATPGNVTPSFSGTASANNAANLMIFTSGLPLFESPWYIGATAALNPVTGIYGTFTANTAGAPSPNYPETMFGTASSTAGATFHVEYEYSPVPESSTVGVIAGLGCLVALARRARA